MYTAILDDEIMGPNYGWFRTAVTQTRFGWDATRKRYDRDSDGRIDRKEFPGSDAEFARLDRDRDMALTQADFDFSASHIASFARRPCSFPAPTGTATASSRTRSWMRFFKACDSRGAGLPLPSDLEEALPLPRREGCPAGDRPSKATLIRGLFRQEIGSLQPGPKLDETAPDFTLKTSDGKSEITLSKLIGPRPVVLIFGNFTCGPFRSQAGNFEKLYHRYKRSRDLRHGLRPGGPPDRRLADGEQRPRRRLHRSAQHLRRAGRGRPAVRTLLGLGFPMLVDTIDDAVGTRYSGMPGRFYLIDRDGKVAFKNGRGPFGFKPAGAGAGPDPHAPGGVFGNPDPHQAGHRELNDRGIRDNQKKLDKILANQATIEANQETILKNQDKLDKTVANQAAILANQEHIKANQEKRRS